jgi:elongation factor Ts
MAVTAKDVMSLRQKTGLGMMECKQALTETDGHVDKAMDLLRQRGLAKMDSRADRTSAEGRIGTLVSPDHTKAAIVEVNTETDFTAGNDSFKAMVVAVTAQVLKQPAGPVAKTDAMQAAVDNVRLTTKENVQFARAHVLGGSPQSRVGAYLHFTGKVGVLVELQADNPAAVSDELLNDLCLHVAAGTPTVALGVTDADIPADIVAKEKEIAKAQAIELGKPEAIAEKMVVGKVRKFFEDHCLILQPFVKDDTKKTRIKDILPKGVSIKAFVRYQVGVR